MSKSEPRTELLPVGPARHIPEGNVRFTRRFTNRLDIEIVDDAGTPMSVATVVVPVSEAPAENCVWLNGRRQNEGVPEALARAGIVKLTGRTCKVGPSEALEAELTDRARAVLAALEEGRIL